MNKYEFLESLEKTLYALPKREKRDRINFYSEMIEDRIEDGMSEEAAVLAVGSIAEISSQMAENGSIKEKERRRAEKKRGTLGKTLLILGSPIWLSLLVAFFAVAFSLYAVMWSVIISVLAVFVALAASAFGGICVSIYTVFSGFGFTSLAIAAAALVCAGLAIFFCFLSKALTRGGVWLTKRIFYPHA